MTHQVGSKGQVVIPKRLRDKRALAPGTRVSFEEREDGILIRADRPLRGLRGRYSHSGLAAGLLDDRAGEPR